MEKVKRILLILIIFLITTHLFIYAKEAELANEDAYTAAYKNYLELSDEEKQDKVLIPNMLKVPSQKVNTNFNRLLKSAFLLGSSFETRYSLLDVIPENEVVRNQGTTNSCWAFSYSAVIESVLGLENHNNGSSTKAYDFSERHLSYAVTRKFANNEINPNGFNCSVGSGGNFIMAEAYSINGLGLVNEEDMPFENNSSLIPLSDIKNKAVQTQLYDTAYFETVEAGGDPTNIMSEMKNHIKTYGGLFAQIYGASTNNDYCNLETGAIYVDKDSYTNAPNSFGPNHAVQIIGWDDDYPVWKFGNKTPAGKGAWIVKNSWGNGKSYAGTLADFKDTMKGLYYDLYSTELNNLGINSASEISDTQLLEFRKKISRYANMNFASCDDFVIKYGTDAGYNYNSTNKIFYSDYGDEGIFYVSYYDANIYSAVSGVMKATDTVNYDNLYSYDEYGMNSWLQVSGTYYLYNIFNKKTSGTEFLTDVGFICYSPVDVYVYVNKTGSGTSNSDFELVKLKAGDYETCTAGFHTLEFAKPLPLTGSSYVVQLKVVPKNSESNYVMLEAKSSSSSALNYYANIESGKCYLKAPNSGISILTDIGANYNSDSTIIAHTKNTDDSEKGLVIVTAPNKTTYYETQNFDKAGMKVYMEYYNNTRKEITDYQISNGTNLKLGQTTVQITYGDYSIDQPITVLKNDISKIEITTSPTKTTYYAGDNFSSSGMVVRATYMAGNQKNISDYQIVNGNNLKNGQTSVTIKYGDKTTTQNITVLENKLENIFIHSNPTKVKYVEGQNFDKTGLVVKGTYSNGNVVEIKDYEIIGGDNLSAGTKEITIKYEECTVKINIEVINKELTSIVLKTSPKLEYEFGENFDRSNGIITAKYNDGSTEDILLTNSQVEISGFDSQKSGKQTLTIKYLGKSIQVIATVKEPRLPENSNFDNSKVEDFDIKAYFYLDNTKNKKIILDGTISNIKKAEVNDSLKYYIYVSNSLAEENITNWISLENASINKGSLEFSVDLSKASNYSELASATKLYVYVKEIAEREGQSKVLTTNPYELNSGNTAIKILLDDIDVTNKLDEILYIDISELTAEELDRTLHSGELPDAGESNIKYIIVLLIPVAIYFYIKNKKMKKIKGIK